MDEMAWVHGQYGSQLDVPGLATFHVWGGMRGRLWGCGYVAGELDESHRIVGRFESKEAAMAQCRAWLEQLRAFKATLETKEATDAE